MYLHVHVCVNVCVCMCVCVWCVWCVCVWCGVVSARAGASSFRLVWLLRSEQAI